MSVLFKPERHQYISLDEDNIDWISVTTLVKQLKQPFDAPTQAAKSSKNKRSKWYKMSVEDILTAWKNEGLRATELGTWYHNQREKDICGLQTLSVHDQEVPVFRPIYDQAGNKVAPSQKLTDGIYPEHFVYLKSAGICGQSDKPEVINSVVDITDYKTNKEIKTQGFTNYEGITQKMLFPVSHLDDCDLNHYSLQLSLYMYIILKHNPKLRPGKLVLHHILFEEEGKDKFGYPIAKRDVEGNPIVANIVPYELPYLRTEVISILHWLTANRHKFKKSKESLVA
jgi:hypothetical protein